MYSPKIGIACGLFGASVWSRSKALLVLAMPKLDTIFYSNTKFKKIQIIS